MLASGARLDQPGVRRPRAAGRAGPLTALGPASHWRWLEATLLPKGPLPPDDAAGSLPPAFSTRLPTSARRRGAGETVW